MSKCGTLVERHLKAMKQPSSLHHRDVERLAVIGDDQVGALEEIRDRGQQRALGGVAGEQELPHLKRAEIEESAAHQERDRPAPPLSPVVSRSMKIVRGNAGRRPPARPATRQRGIQNRQSASASSTSQSPMRMPPCQRSAS